MNISVLKKLESGYVKLHWDTQCHKFHINDLETIVDIIDNFKSKTNVKELIVSKFKIVPAYIYIRPEDYISILNWICQKYIDVEMYEKCVRIKELILSIEIKRLL
jgi:hypothetical protein